MNMNSTKRARATWRPAPDAASPGVANLQRRRQASMASSLSPGGERPGKQAASTA